MSLIPKVKCGRCDRSYSGLKFRCPYCGAGRSRGGKRASDVGDATARRMIKALLLLALVITVIAVAVMDLDGEPAGATTEPGSGSGTTLNGGGTEENGDEEENGPSLPPPPAPPSPSPIAVTSISINWAANVGFNDMTIGVGHQLELWAEIFPTDADAVINWTTEVPTVAGITINPEDHRRVTLEGRGPGETVIRVTAGGESATVLVRVN